ncbi:hypothetical protein [Micromonospora sp. WMMD736]|uniref:hypothetical protein n=1 Tax=Micromonospora sp. WMMD736 TaxID=3404112 RepID=UPI003B95887C
MAEVYKYVNGQTLEGAIADMVGVQRSLGKYAFEIKAYADAYLIEARDHSVSIGRRIDWDAFIEVLRWRGGRGGGSGWDVVLNDTLGDGAAYNIERGRRVEFYDDETGLPLGEMEGLFLLERAVQVVADRHRSELRGR